jgi:hypothetical protein
LVVGPFIKVGFPPAHSLLAASLVLITIFEVCGNL